MQNLSGQTYEGFSKPEANFFRLPNEWTDITAHLTSLAEMKLVEYVLKHTWGYSEFDVVKKITTDEFMYGRKKKNGERIDIVTGQETSFPSERVMVREGEESSSCTSYNSQFVNPLSATSPPDQSPDIFN